MPKRNSIISCSIFGVALLILFIAATYRLSEAPATWYDEGFYSQMAMNFKEVGKQALQVAPGVYTSSSYVTVGYPLIAPIAASYAVFGEGVVQGRYVMALFLIAFALGSFFLIKKQFGAATASWTLLFLATFPMLYGNGKPVLGEVPGLFFLIATLIALYYLEQDGYKDWRKYVAVGLLAGLCAATKIFFALFVIALGITLLLKWKVAARNWRGVIYAIIAVLVPLGIWAYFQFGSEATVSSVLSYYSNPYAVENLPAHILENARRFVTEQTPLYTALMLLAWGASLWTRKQKGISAVELSAFSFAILVILSYLRLEGWYRYLFPATMTAVVFFPAALANLAAYAQTKIPFLNRIPWLAYSIVAILALLQLYQTAHSSYVAQYYQSTRTHDAAAALKDISPQQSVFLYNVPELAIMLPSKNYYQYLDPLPNVHLGEEELALLQAGTPDRVIVESALREKTPGLFSHYVTEKTIDRYEILIRK